MKTQRTKNIEFGMLVTFVLLILSLWLKNDWYRYAVVTLAVALLIPVLYTPFTRLWFGFAKLLEQVMSKVVLFLIFFTVITPVGIFRRIAGKDTLRLKRFRKDKTSVFEEKKQLYTQKDLEKQF